MDKEFGTQYQNFYLMSQTEDVVAGWLVWIDARDKVIASRKGINKNYPHWSYLFWRTYTTTAVEGFTLMQAGDKGWGFTYAVEEGFRKIIETYETGTKCTCNKAETNKISYEASRLTVWTMDLVCDANGATSVLAYNSDGLWTSAKPKNCWYIIFTAY